MRVRARGLRVSVRVREVRARDARARAGKSCAIVPLIFLKLKSCVKLKNHVAGNIYCVGTSKSFAKIPCTGDFLEAILHCYPLG